MRRSPAGRDRSVGTILVLGPALSAASGVSTHVRELLAGVSVLGWRILHFEVGSEGRNEGIWRRLWRIGSGPALLAFQLWRTGAEVVHVNASMDGKSIARDLVFALVARVMGRGTVVQVHGGESPGEFCRRGWLWCRAAALLMRTGRVVVVLGESLARDYRTYFPGVDPIVIRNGIDVESLAPSSSRTFDGPLRFIYLGRLTDTKGIREGIDAFAWLRREGQLEGCEFLIAGDGPERERLEEQCQRLKVSDVVGFVGLVKGRERERFLREASILVFPTYHREALPYAIIEAMAAGVPVVTTRVGVIGEMMDDGVEGLFVQPRNVLAVKKALESMVRDRGMLRQMSERAVWRARKEFSREVMVHAFCRTYESAAGRQGGREEALRK